MAHSTHHRPASSGITLAITSLNENGFGVGQKAGQTLTVARSAPGDQVLVMPKSSARWTAADLIKVVKPSPERVVSPCHAFDQGCGGCQWLHLDYKAQLAWKEKNLAAVLRTKAGFRGVIHPILGMDKPDAYRNKLSLKNVAGRWVFVPEFDETPLAPRECLVQTTALQKAWAALRKLKAPPGVEQLHLRSNAAGQVGLHAFAGDRAPTMEASLKSLLEATGGVGLGATGHGYRHVAGERSLLQTLGGTSWLIPHNGFYQTNEPMAGVLLELVKREARVSASDRLLDLYCGAGFFGLALAPAVSQVIGIEENPQSVEAAAASSRRSGVTNAKFLAGDLGAVLASLDKAPHEIAVVDPPREGLLPQAIETLVARAPQRIVYVSCYPQSLTRDLKRLLAAGWRGVSCAPVDMFPHTSHLEVVVVLER